MRPIDADDLIKAFETLGLMSGESFTNMARKRSMEIERVKDYINNAETIDPAQVVHAHWILIPQMKLFSHKRIVKCSHFYGSSRF